MLSSDIETLRSLLVNICHGEDCAPPEAANLMFSHAAEIAQSNGIPRATVQDWALAVISRWMTFEQLAIELDRQRQRQRQTRT